MRARIRADDGGVETRAYGEVRLADSYEPVRSGPGHDEELLDVSKALAVPRVRRERLVRGAQHRGALVGGDWDRGEVHGWCAGADGRAGARVECGFRHLPVDAAL